MKGGHLMRSPFRPPLAIALVSLLAAAPLLQAQLIGKTPYERGEDPANIGPTKPTSLLRTYEPEPSPPVRLANSDRLRQLIRAGNLYLTVQDAVALTIENNIDIEVERYNPIAAAWAIQRAEAGGATRGVTNAAGSASAPITSGQGVVGSQQAAGVNTQGGVKTSISPGNATISQIGPVTQLLDAFVSDTTSFSHTTTIENNILQTGTLALVDGRRNYSASLQQGLLTGGTVSVAYSNSYLNEDIPSDVLNPSLAGSLSITLEQNFLQGFGVGVNSRFITVAKRSLEVSDLNFRNQIINVVSNVLGQYYQLVADRESLAATHSAVTLAQQLLSDNQRQVELGSLAPIEITRAQAQVATAEQDVTVAETTEQQQEVQIKNLISRNGIADPLLAEVRVIPIDVIHVPEQETIAPLPDLVKQALNTRLDLRIDQINFENSTTSALGTRNGVLPTLLGVVFASNAGLAGSPNPLAAAYGLAPVPSVVGGVGTELKQIFGRDFPSELAGVEFVGSVRNRTAQADSAIDQLQLRQSELSNQRDRNQAIVVVSNAVVGLRQARVRYQAAVKNLTLEEQLLDAEQKRFRLGSSTSFNVITQQRDLATAQSNLVSAQAAYASARITLDQVLGTTLENLNINVEEARVGRIKQASSLPEHLPEVAAPAPR
jgi:outer membrane protein TolC